MKKLLYLTTVLMAMMFVASCTDDVNFGPAPAPDGQQLYFDKDQPSKVKLELNQKEIKIPINRVETDEISTISILGTVVDKEGTAVTGIFTLPQSVTFAAGAKTADAVILVDFAALSVDKEYVVTLEIADEANTTPYGNSTYTFKASYPAPWKVLGKGLYADDIMTLYSAVAPGTTVTVEIQESEVTAGLYRLKNPYGEEFAEKSGFSGEGITYSAADYYIEIDCTNPEAVTIAQQSIGVTVDGFGTLETRSEEPGVLKDKIIKFPKKGLAVFTPATGKGYYANTNAAFVVALPGAVLISPEVKVEFVGSFIAPDATANALLQLTPNEDVRYYKYAVVDGSVKDITATVAGIIDGSIESIKHESAGEEEVVNYPLDKSGKYTAVVIPYGEKDYQGEPASVQFKFSVGGDTPVPDPVVGSYEIKVAASKPYTSTVILEEGTGMNEGKYILTGLFGLELPLIGVYNDTDYTLTFDGLVNGRETEGTYFGSIIGYANKEKTVGFGIFSGSGDEGQDPFVIELSDGALSMTQVPISLELFDKKEGGGWAYKGTAELIAVNTPFTKIADASGVQQKSFRNVGGILFSSVAVDGFRGAKVQ